MKTILKLAHKADLLAIGAALVLFSSSASAGVPPAQVPEPGPFGLLVLGGVALIVARRFRRNK